MPRTPHFTRRGIEKFVLRFRQMSQSSMRLRGTIRCQLCIVGYFQINFALEIISLVKLTFGTTLLHWYIILSFLQRSCVSYTCSSFYFKPKYGFVSLFMLYFRSDWQDLSTYHVLFTIYFFGVYIYCNLSISLLFVRKERSSCFYTDKISFKDGSRPDLTRHQGKFFSGVFSFL